MRPQHRDRPGRTTARARVGLLTLLIPLATAATAAAQPGGAKPESKLKEPAPFRVYQRDANGTADIPVVPDDASKDVKITTVTVVSPNGQIPSRFEGGKILDVPPGGPYRINLQADGVGLVVHNVYVGDLWILAGQSNMEGVGDLADVVPPSPMVQVLGMNGAWSRAEEPLHWLVDSPDPVHSGDEATRESRSAEQHRSRKKGAGLGLAFATDVARETGVPVGLVACAHGGTSMAQWSPAKKGEGGQSLYGSMLRQVNLAGGKARGVLWYQGESDANPEASGGYGKAFADFIAAVRDDLGQPELPFYFVQIGRVVRGGDPKDWNAVQDAERRLAERVSNAAVVASIDLELDDGIHIGTQGLKRLGKRLSNIALRELFGKVGATTPTFDRVNKGANNTLVVKFKGVNFGPEAQPTSPQTPGTLGLGRPVAAPSVGGQAEAVGLRPARHIAGFSVRKEDGTEIPLIYDAAVGNARDTVVLRLNGKLPEGEKAFLWYGHGFDPYCNLTDGRDMAVPVFGPVPLDELP